MQCVVGPHGFLGSAAVRRLASEGLEAQGFVRTDSWRTPGGEPSPVLQRSDVVYWLAGAVNPATADQRPDLVAADLRAVSEFAAAVAGTAVRRVVLASSGGTVYDTQQPPPYSESANTGPLSTYGRYKLLQEQLFSESLPDDVELVTLRVGNAYGPGQPVGTGQGVIAYWLDAALNGRPLVLIGPPDTTRDFTYIDDVAAALVHFGRVELDSPRAVFNIGSGTPTELGVLAATIMDVVADRRLQLESMPARPFDVPHMWLDVASANIAGWHATTGLVDGITRSWAALVAQVPA